MEARQRPELSGEAGQVKTDVPWFGLAAVGAGG
jgi:hypothetical protein